MGGGGESVTDDNHETRNESSFIFGLDFLKVLFSHRLVVFNFDDSYMYYVQVCTMYTYKVALLCTMYMMCLIV